MEFVRSRLNFPKLANKSFTLTNRAFSFSTVLVRNYLSQKKKDAFSVRTLPPFPSPLVLSRKHLQKRLKVGLLFFKYREVAVKKRIARI